MEPISFARDGLWVLNRISRIAGRPSYYYLEEENAILFFRTETEADDYAIGELNGEYSSARFESIEQVKEFLNNLAMMGKEHVAIATDDEPDICTADYFLQNGLG